MPLPKMIIAIPAATSLTLGSSVKPACSRPSRLPAITAASTPIQGEPVQSETPNAVIAPINKTPSIPRLMRPLFSVRHSPRLTYMYGMLPRIAPPSSAVPIHTAGESGLSTGRLPKVFEHGESAVKRFAGKHHQKHDSLEDRDGGIR